MELYNELQRHYRELDYQMQLARRMQQYAILIKQPEYDDALFTSPPGPCVKTSMMW